MQYCRVKFIHITNLSTLYDSSHQLWLIGDQSKNDKWKTKTGVSSSNDK